MIVFRHAAHAAKVEELAAAWRAAPGGLEELLAAARLEQAVVDFWAAEGDDWEPRRQGLAELSLAAARRALGQAAARPEPADLPEAGTVLAVGEPEGLKYYGLWPPAWAEAARHWQSGRRQPVWVLGLRTMGSVLASMAAAGLAGGGHRLSTLRPRGDPHDRRIVAGARLQREIAMWPGAFLVVDEGPGLSGSSIGGTMRFLIERGIAEDRIGILASWRPAAERLGSPYARAGWPRWRVEVADGLPAPPGDEIGGGGWRRALGRAGPAWGEHERRKVLLPGGTRLAKFAGLGGYGAATRERARALACAGWGPQVEEEAPEGWIVYRRLPTRRARPDGAWAAFAGGYLAWVRSNHTLGEARPVSHALQEMARVNLAAAGVRRGDAPAGPEVALDGRMLPHEWGLTARGWVKFDGTDHGDDPFFPGPADIAWDLAAIGIEFGPALGAAAREEYTRRSGDGGRQLEARLRWHGLAYAAFRWAYCALAAERTQGVDAAWFRAATRRYRACLGRPGVRPGGSRSHRPEARAGTCWAGGRGG